MSEGIAMLGISLPMAAAAAATMLILVDQPAFTINENNVRGLHDVTVLLPSAYKPSDPTKCTLTLGNERTHNKMFAFGGTIILSYSEACILADVKQWEARQAQFVRKAFGDRGKH